MNTAKVSTNREIWIVSVSHITFALLIVAAFYSRGWFYLTGDIRSVVNSVPDDTAYFYKIAWNVVNGKGLTFDGINLTNGFQPLWLYLLLPLAWLMREASPEAYFRAALIYQAIIVLISGAVLYFTIQRITAHWVALATTSLFFLFGRSYFINGMETGILVLCLTLLLAYCLRYRPFWEPNPRVAFGFGALAGVLLLARLDMVFLLLISYIVIAGRIFVLWRNQENAKLLITDCIFSIIALLAITLPYFIYNKIVFGAIMPISGQLKNSFPYLVQPEFGLARFSVRSLIAVGIAALFSFGAIIFRRRFLNSSEETRLLYIFTLIFAATTLAHYLNTALFMKWAVFRWHFAPYFFTLCLIFCSVTTMLFGRFFQYRQLLATSGAVAFVLVISLFMIVKTSELYNSRGWHSVAYEAAVWARQNTPPEAVFAMKDAGIFGLFSQRAVINLDGLVNNMEYQEYLRQKRLNQYLAEKGVQYLVQHAMHDDAERNQLTLTGEYEFVDFPYRSQRYGNWSDPVRLYRTDEVFRSSPYYDSGYRTVFLIWRLRYDQNSKGIR